MNEKISVILKDGTYIEDIDEYINSVRLHHLMDYFVEHYIHKEGDKIKIFNKVVDELIEKCETFLDYFCLGQLMSIFRKYDTAVILYTDALKLVEEKWELELMKNELANVFLNPGYNIQYFRENDESFRFYKDDDTPLTKAEEVEHYMKLKDNDEAFERKN